MKKRLILALFVILIVLISSCSLTGKKGSSSSKTSKSKKAVEDIRVGTQGIVVSFLPNNPPERVVVEENAENLIKVVLQVNNKGAYPQPDEKSPTRGTAPFPAKLYLSGYDPNIIISTQREVDLSTKALEGRSTINPNGGIDFVDFSGRIIFDNLNVERYEPTLLATACYYYNTIASPQVCIDTDPYSEISTKKVCEVADISLSNQGAPVAVTKIAEEALATKTQFRITIKNVGGGDTIKIMSAHKCDPLGTEKLEREDIDKVYVVEVSLGNKLLNCGPYAEGAIKHTAGGFVRLINGEGNIICEFPRQDYPQGANTAYTTPLKIHLGYTYRTTVERKVLIKKEVSGLASPPPLEPLPAMQIDTGKK